MPASWRLSRGYPMKPKLMLTKPVDFGPVRGGQRLLQVKGGIPVHLAHNQALVLVDLIQTLALVAAENSDGESHVSNGRTFNVFMTLELLAEMTSATLSSMDYALTHANNPPPRKRLLQRFGHRFKALGSALLALAFRRRRA